MLGTFGSLETYCRNLAEVLNYARHILLHTCIGTVTNYRPDLPRRCYWNEIREAHWVTECNDAPCMGSSNLFLHFGCVTIWMTRQHTRFLSAKPRTSSAFSRIANDKSHPVWNRTLHPRRNRSACAFDVPFTYVASDCGRTGLCISFCISYPYTYTLNNSRCGPR
jgi:hypothetical protein